MNFRILSLFAVVSLAASQMAFADTKIGFVNSEKVMREAAPAVRAQQRIEKEFAKREQELQRMAKDLQAMQKDLENPSGKIPEADLRNKERAFNDLSRDFQRKQRDYREEFNQRRNEELTSVLDKANRVIKQIAENEHYDLILQDTVYYNPRIDITDKVIKALAADTK